MPCEVGFEHWEKKHDIAFAHEVSFQIGSAVNRFSFASLEPRAKDFEPARRTPSSRAHFAEGSPSELTIEQVKREGQASGQLLVQVNLDGHDDRWFVFDSGASASVLDLGEAKARGLEPFGEIMTKSVSGLKKAGFFQLASLRVGPLILETPILTGSDLSSMAEMLGRPVSGVIGYDVLACATVEFDGAHARIALFDPVRYAREGVHWVPVVLGNRVPCLPASIEDHEGLFRLDTGSGGGEITLHAPAVERLKLLEGRETKDRGGIVGVGGTIKSVQGRVRSLVIGDLRFEDLGAEFVLHGTGVLADPYTLGSLSSRAFPEHMIVFDYPHKRVGFVRTK